jgi:glutaredoxin 3
MTNITLFQFETCPYCAKVRAKLDELGLEYERVNVSPNREDPQRKEIAEKSGVGTVPIIKIDGKYIGESGDIIEHLEENFKA